ncbi:hypothetical protein P8605_09230 [Streptomyces sp. T-3]|nr:hypothetical protein [Streptomyces sp. T-3]
MHPALTAVLVLVGLAVLGTVARAVTQANNQGAGPDSSYPAAEYKLDLPKTLLDGDYTFAQDHSSAAPQDDGTFSREDMKDWESVGGQYTGKDSAALVVVGSYGRIRNPDNMREAMMRGAEDGQNATLVVPAKDIRPAGSDLTLSCQVLTFDAGTTKTTVPMCAWADDNTAASVSEATPEIVTQDPEEVDLEKVAERALQVREEMRKPIN